VALGPETCQECGKAITRKAIAHVWAGERVVCNGCFRKLDREKRDRESRERAVSAPATDRQIAYAQDLAIPLWAGITSQQISDLIDAKVNPPASPHLLQVARSWGLDPQPGIRTKYLDNLIWDRRWILGWVYSVLRQLTAARWVVLSDCPVALPVMMQIADAVAGDKVLRRLVDDADSGDPPQWFDDAEESRGIEDNAVAWFFFGGGGPSTRSKVFALTRDVIAKYVRLPEA
jgi:hypothetical protein